MLINTKGNAVDSSENRERSRLLTDQLKFLNANALYLSTVLGTCLNVSWEADLPFEQAPLLAHLKQSFGWTPPTIVYGDLNYFDAFEVYLRGLPPR